MGRLDRDRAAICSRIPPASAGQYFLGVPSSRIANLGDRWLAPPALLFFKAMSDGGFDPDARIDVLLRHQLIYISVPECASTAIKSGLSALELGLAPPPDKVHTRPYSGLKSPTQVGLSAFRRLTNSAATLQFAFVRDPDARLVLAWADKFQNRPALPAAHGQPTGNALDWRPRAGHSPPPP
jgi:Sulfotransferase family